MSMAVTAYVLITTANKEAKHVLDQLRAAHIVREAYAVTGPYDIIATVAAEDMDALGPLITQQVQGIDGIERTLTCNVRKG
jgi:DNA-binding Lrp family transcriptional regulator